MSFLLDSSNAPGSDRVIRESIRKSYQESTIELIFLVFFEINIFVDMLSGRENHYAFTCGIVRQCCTELISTVFVAERGLLKKKLVTGKFPTRARRLYHHFT